MAVRERTLRRSEGIGGVDRWPGPVHHVDVTDPFADDTGIAEITGLTDDLERRVPAGTPRGAPNPGACAFRASSRSLRRWLDLMPSAAALQPLYDPDRGIDGHRADEVAQAWFRHGNDAIAIRARAVMMRDAVARHVPAPAPVRVLSLACGCAEPVMDVLGRRPGSHLTLVDIDRDALDTARRVAADRDLTDAVTTRRANILRHGSLAGAVGVARFDVVELLGFLEYVPDTWPSAKGRTGAAGLLAAAWELVAPGGVLVFGNMLADRPNLDFLLHVVQWPIIVPRSRGELAALVSRAGLRPDEVELAESGDGVYGVLTARKRGAAGQS